MSTIGPPASVPLQTNVGLGHSRWPSPGALLRGPQLLLRGPQLLLRGPRMLLRAPVAVLRAGKQRRLFSTSRLRRKQQQPIEDSPIHATSQAGPSSKPRDPQQTQQPKGSFTARLRERLNNSPTKWYPIPVSLGVAVLVAVNFYKGRVWEGVDENDVKGKKKMPVGQDDISVKGPWQVHVIGALPLRSMSRLYGMVNSYTLPVWFRVPGYKLYSFVFGVNLDECDPPDLREYNSMSEFFMRKLKPGVRPIANTQLVSPADGRIVNFGVVEGGRVEQVKGSTYSLEALLSGTGQVEDSFKSPDNSFKPHPHQAEGTHVDEKEFANVNGIQYSLGELLGPDDGEKNSKDASMSREEQRAQPNGLKRTVSSDARVAMEVAPSTAPWSSNEVPKPGNKLFFTVVYLAPGDYHRFHSPASWVVEKRRHFAGELFSVSPWMAAKLQDLFVLNERVALLGRWRHGFFSMVPVGATNVGSIRVNFDSSLRTNSPLRPITPGTFSEATYSKASSLLGGQPLRAGDEIGGFWLGSTIVLVFEAPENFEFSIQMQDKVKMGQSLGDVKE